MNRFIVLLALCCTCSVLMASTNGRLGHSGRSLSAQSAVTEDEKFDHHGIMRTVPEVVTFNAHIRGIMSNTCFACHGPDEEDNQSGLRLDSFEAAVEEGQAIEPGDAASSAVYQRIIDKDDPMPPSDFQHQLTDYEIALFKKWISQGAKYEEHWAYAPIRQFDPPTATDHSEWINNPIDAFVFARLQQEGLTPSPRADKATLLRRLSLDLTGLPPTPDELRGFIEDTSAKAYEKQVDRLLASPHYGERMAAFWLDIIRFSDTVGFHGDQNQRIFPYRDYVIDSLNRNQPFDEFTREQLAGDLLPDPTDDQLTATGLVRLNMVTREGGAQPAEYLAKYTADRVRMIGTAWLGATTGCCECHNHKYDPFSLEDFYSLGAFFNDVRQWGVYSSYGYTPNPDLAGFNNDFPFPPEMRRESKSLDSQIQFLEARLEQKASDLLAEDEASSKEFKRWLERVIPTTASDQWLVAKPTKVKLSAEEPYEVLPDHSVLFSGDPKETQRSEITLQFDWPRIVRSIRLQVLPDDANNGFVGRGKNGSFRVTTSIYHRPKTSREQKPIKVMPRFVRIELPGTQYLSLAEVQVFSKVAGELTNIARDGKATQSSIYTNGEPARAIDGNTSGDRAKDLSVTHTKNDPKAWWEVDLKRESEIEQIVIWNRTDGQFQKRLNGFQVVLLDEDRKEILRKSPKLPKPSVKIEIPEEVIPGDNITPLKTAFSVCDRSSPKKYKSGRPPRYLEGEWRSGPVRWQLPSAEAKMEHTAVFNLDQAVTVDAGSELTVMLDSNDVGRIRLSVSPFARMVAGKAAVSDKLASALNALADSSIASSVRDSQSNNQTSVTGIEDSIQMEKLSELGRSERIAIQAAYYQFLTAFEKQPAALRDLADRIADCHSGLAMTLVSQPVESEKIRQSRVLPRGDWQDESGKPVEPQTPHFLPGYQTDTERRLDRRDLADWLTSPDNPLTPRHYVNRIWAQFFGSGLSNKLDDLGNQGEWPSHPLLMDWLANEFRNGWDRKKIVRLIVTSHTYQQKAAANEELKRSDPYNRLLGQQSARRLEAEIVRDNALEIAGLLNRSWIGGPSVYPYQPPGYYSNLQFPNRSYIPDRDGRQYRRGVYMHWQRTFLHPMLTNFDAPSRDECVAGRTQSNSPQQALTLLNDPVFVEASRAFSDRILTESERPDIQAWIKTGFEIAVARKPSTAETEALSRLFESQRQYFRSNPSEADAFEAVGQFRPAEREISKAEFAALSQVCRVILNLHETITRY